MAVTAGELVGLGMWAALAEKVAAGTVDGDITGVANTWTANQTLSNVNLVLGTGAGTKIGTATGQKLGFWGATPVVQPTVAADATVATLITALTSIGLIKNA